MEYGFIFWSNLVAYQTCAGTAVLALQVVVVLSMQHLFKQQNARIIGITCPVAGAAPAGRSGGCSTRIANILEEEMKNHLALSEALVTTNKVLEVSRNSVPRSDPSKQGWEISKLDRTRECENY